VPVHHSVSRLILQRVCELVRILLLRASDSWSHSLKFHISIATLTAVIIPYIYRVTATPSRVLRSGASPRLTTLRQLSRSPVVKAPPPPTSVPATPARNSLRVSRSPVVKAPPPPTSVPATPARSSLRLVSRSPVVKAPPTSSAASASPSARSSVDAADEESPSKIMMEVSQVMSLSANKAASSPLPVSALKSKLAKTELSKKKQHYPSPIIRGRGISLLSKSDITKMYSMGSRAAE
jgi:hypothetical protein